MFTAFVNSLLAAASLLTDAGNFLRAAATPLVVFENLPLAAASLLTDSGNFLRVAGTPLVVFENFDPVLEPL